MWCARSIGELIQDILSSPGDGLELLRVRITSVKSWGVATEVLQPIVMKDSWRTVFLLQASDFSAPRMLADTLLF